MVHAAQDTFKNQLCTPMGLYASPAQIARVRVRLGPVSMPVAWSLVAADTSDGPRFTDKLRIETNDIMAGPPT